MASVSVVFSSSCHGSSSSSGFSSALANMSSTVVAGMACTIARGESAVTPGVLNQVIGPAVVDANSPVR